MVVVSRRVAARIAHLWADAAWDARVNPTGAAIMGREYVRLLTVAAPGRTDREIATRFREVRDRVFSPGELRRLGFGDEASPAPDATPAAEASGTEGG